MLRIGILRHKMNNNNGTNSEIGFNENTLSLSFQEFENKVLKNTQWKKGFSILHLNIRSINKNFENFKHFLIGLRIEFDVICLTETWWEEKHLVNKYQLQNYTVFHQIRNNTLKKTGGGVCIFVKKSLTTKTCEGLNINNADCESMSIEIINKKSKNIILTTVYRPPNGNVKNFTKFLKSHYNKTKDKDFYLIGDLNINVFEYNKNKNTTNFFNKIFQNGLIPLISKATRITSNTSTAIDNIITNTFLKHITQAGIIKTDLTDHFPIFCIVDKIAEKQPIKQKINTRKFTNDAKCYFNSLLLNETDWNLLYDSTDINCAYELFEKLFKNAYDKAFPVEEKTVSPIKSKSPWFTAGLRKSSRKKQKLYEKFLKNRTWKNEKNYLTYKKRFEKIKLTAKKNYYNQQTCKYKNNTKKTWDVIKEVEGKKRVPSDSPNCVLVNDKLCRDQNTIAEKFNKFFINVGPELASKIQHEMQNHLTYVSPCQNTMENNELTETEFIKAFNSLKLNKAPGLDDFNVNIITQSFQIIKTPLFFLFDMSLKQGIFPDSLKRAKIIPIYKKGDPYDVSNYRPISILSCFSKILEKIMYNRLERYLITNKLLSQSQYGFQAAHSTEQAILYLTDKISKRFENKLYTLGIFFDLSKAFDTVNHKILLEKLNHYGITGSSLSWLCSYLTNRKQCVKIENHYSNFQKIVCGVPQGSILGPLLFLIYINDIQNCSEILDFVLFADDTNIFLSGKNIQKLFTTMNEEISKINSWFETNKLTVNIDKTCYSIFHSQKQNNFVQTAPKLMIGNKSIQRKPFIKFLGVYIDENLKWNHHIKNVVNKICRNIGILYKIRKLLNSHCLKLFYDAFIHSHISYANIAWASTYSTKLKKIYSKQKCAQKLIVKKDAKTAINILSIFEINILKTLEFMYKWNNGLLPRSYETCFTKTKHKYITRRSKTSLSIPRCKTKYRSFAISYRGPKLWNYFKTLNKNTYTTAQSFKKAVKEILQQTSSTEILKLF